MLDYVLFHSVPSEWRLHLILRVGMTLPLCILAYIISFTLWAKKHLEQCIFIFASLFVISATAHLWLALQSESHEAAFVSDIIHLFVAHALLVKSAVCVWVISLHPCRGFMI